MNLTSKQKADLKALAQHLNVILKIGDKGITPAVIKSLDEALKARELVKISVAHPDRNIRRKLIIELADATLATVVNIIGKTALIYRSNPDNPLISKNYKP